MGPLPLWANKHNVIKTWGLYHYGQTNTNNVNKTWGLLQTPRGKNEPNIVFIRKSGMNSGTLKG
jgi:hypothetical protein